MLSVTMEQENELIGLCVCEVCNTDTLKDRAKTHLFLHDPNYAKHES